MAGRILGYLRRHGARYTLRRLREKLAERYLGTWDRAWAEERATEEQLERQRAQQPDAGRISVCVPVYRTDAVMLRALCESLCAQTYRDWEGCFFDAGGSAETAEILREFAARDRRFRAAFSSDNAGIAGNTNRAFAMATGEWLALCDHDDLLTPDALWLAADCIARETPDAIFTDEDKVTEDGRRHTDPHRKPDFCPDNLRSSNYVCHMLVMRRALVEEIGGERPAMDGSQDHDITLRLSERTQRIAHVPHICYHWRTVGSSMSHQHLDRCLEASCRAVEEHMARIGYPGTARPESGQIRLRYALKKPLSVCVLALGGDTEVPGAARTTVLPRDWAAVSRAAAEADEDMILLADACVKGFSKGFLEELAMYAQREDVGIAVPVLLDRRGCITHAGYETAGGSLVPRNEGLKLSAGGWHEMARQTHNISAAAGLCLLIRRDHFLPIPSEGIPEWCLRLTEERGLRHVYTPWASALAPKPAPEPLPETRRGWHDPCGHIPA